MRTRRLTLAALALALALPAPALADDDDKASARGTCGQGATSRLKLEEDDGRIEVEFKVDHARGGIWRVVLVHEARVEWRGRARVRGRRGSLKLRRSVRDFDGSDRISVRAVGPSGIVCAAAATLPD